MKKENKKEEKLKPLLQEKRLANRNTDSKGLILSEYDAAYGWELKQLSSRISELEDINIKLRENMLLRDSVERAMRQEFKSQMEQKDAMIRKLQGMDSQGLPPEQGEQGVSYRAIEKAEYPRMELAGQEAENLRMELKEKEAEIKRLASYYREKEDAYEYIRAQLISNLEKRNSEMQQIKSLLKSLVEEMEGQSQQIEEQLQNLKSQQPLDSTSTSKQQANNRQHANPRFMG